MTKPYTYLIRHKPSGLLYHGSRTSKTCDPSELLKTNGYKTSSKIVKELIATDGLDSFEILNIEVWEDTDSAGLAESQYHKIFEVKSNICYMNQWNAGEKWYCSGHTDETKAKISSSLVGKMAGENHPLYGKKHTDETKEKFKYRNYCSGENHYAYSKKRSDDSKRKTSESLKGKFIGEKSCWFGKKGELSTFYGSKHSDEAKAKMRSSRPRVKCPHCNKEGDVMNMKRWHFDNCKHKIQEAA